MKGAELFSDTGDALAFGHLVNDAFSLRGMTAVVTGAGSLGRGIGIGRAAAILLAEAGARVGLIDASQDAAEQTNGIIAERGGTAMVSVADLADEQQVERAIREITGALGPASILVNNVGIVGPAGDSEEVDLGHWDAAMAVNVRSMVITSRCVLPQMRRLGGGSIINVSSVAGMGGGYPAVFYPTSKGAVISLTRTMAAHHGREGIRVNAVAPGQLFTPRIGARGISKEMRESRTRSSLLGTEGTGWDAGYAILYLASPAARWVTGVLLPVDAGLTGTIPLESPRARD